MCSLLILLFASSVCGAKYRLPTDLRPTSYQLDLEFPDVSADPPPKRFNGTVTIALKVEKETNSIWLSQNQIEITDNTLTIGRGLPRISVHAHGRVQKYDDLLMLKIEFNVTIKPDDRVALRLTYTAKFGSQLGVFYASYGPRDSITTQFQTIYARDALPCFDEPDFRAYFDVTVRHVDGTVALSNGATKESIIQDSTRVTRFDRSPLMPPYLLAFAVLNNTVETSGVDAEGTKVSFWNTKSCSGNKKEIKETENALIYFRNYFKMKYAVKKLDSIFHEFGPAGMENWGLITYGYANNSKCSTAGSGLVIHELAHQWTGNTVTCEWWDEIWLNEGMASFFQVEGSCSNKICKECCKLCQRCPLQKSADEVFSSRARLCLTYPGACNFPTPIHLSQWEDKLPTNSDIGVVSGAIYGRASLVIRMIQTVIGRTAFQKAMQDYLRENEFQSVTRFALYKALQKHTKIDIESFVEGWVTQPNYPIVTAKLTGTVYTLSQISSANDSSTWTIPLYYDIYRNTTVVKSKLLWLKPNGTAKLVVREDEHIKFNPNNVAIAIVKYSPSDYDEFQVNLLEDDKVSAETKNNILCDAFVLARLGKLAYSTALFLVKNLSKPTVSIVVELDVHLQFIYNWVEKRQQLSIFASSILSQMFVVDGDSPATLRFARIIQMLWLHRSKGANAERIESMYADARAKYDREASGPYGAAPQVDSSLEDQTDYGEARKKAVEQWLLEYVE